LKPQPMSRRGVIRAVSLLTPAVLIAVAMWSAGVRLGDRPPSSSERDAPEPLERVGGQQGRLSNEAIEAAEPIQPAASPEQSFALFATVPGRNSGEGSATLGTAAGNAKTYAAGALLANRMRLVEIHPQFVVLERSGERQRLYLQSTAQAQAGTDAAAARELTLSSDTQQAQMLQPLRDALSEVVRAMALYEQDQLAGLELRAGARQQVFAQLGLEEGDVLVEIDGAPVTDVQAATQQLRSVMDGAALPVRIRRGGSFTTMTLDGAVAMSSAAAIVSSPAR
jgi:general secretion pathway protein C